MSPNRQIWVHPASFLYQFEEPVKRLETVWVFHPDWGYLKRRDLWVRLEVDLDDLQSLGYCERKSDEADEVLYCPFCDMFIDSVPGYLIRKHFEECGGVGDDDWRKLEDLVVSEKRERTYHKKILDEILRKKREEREAEQRERLDRVREEQVARQFAKDRKRRLREEARETLRKRDRM